MPQTRVPTVASALPLSPTTSVPARLSSLARPANRMSMSVIQTLHPARMEGRASMTLAATDASARQSTQGSTARAGTCPATRHPAKMEAHASRRERPATNAPVCQVEHYTEYIIMGLN